MDVPKTGNGATAYQKGRQAFQDGKPMKDNFYSWNSRVAGLAAWWDRGWLDAKRKSEESK